MLGPIKFDSKGDVVNAAYAIYKWHDGNYSVFALHPKTRKSLLFVNKKKQKNLFLARAFSASGQSREFLRRLSQATAPLTFQKFSGSFFKKELFRLSWSPYKRRMSTLDPTTGPHLRALGHRMMDDMIDHLANIARRPGLAANARRGPRRVSQRPCRRRRRARLRRSTRVSRDSIQPYVTGNTHPRFMGWVHGGGNPVSMLAELLAGAMNANCGGRDHVGIAVERQVIAWAAEMLGHAGADRRRAAHRLLDGEFRRRALRAATRRWGRSAARNGLGGAKLTAYAVAGVHRCVPGALDMAGLGADALRKIPVDADYRMDIARLARRHRARTARPASRPSSSSAPPAAWMSARSTILPRWPTSRAAEDIWFHVDGAFGALAALSPTLTPAPRRHRARGFRRLRFP